MHSYVRIVVPPKITVKHHLIFIFLEKIELTSPYKRMQYTIRLRDLFCFTPKLHI